MADPASRLRVAVDAVHSKTGGGLTYLRNVLPLLVAEPDMELHLFASSNIAELLAPLDPRIQLHLVAPWRGRLAEALWEQICLPQLLRAGRIDVTFCPANFAPIAAPRPVVLLRNALGVIGRERRPALIAYWAVLAVATWASLLRCRYAIAVSDYARRTIAGPLRRRVKVVPHGVSKPFEPGSEKRESFLLAVGDLYTQKNLHTLIDAFAILGAARPGLELRVAGRRVDEDYALALERQMERLGLAESVLLIGAVAPEALATLYRRCAVFVFPSTVETFGNPLLEAMACGAAVACACAAAMPEILDDAGIYFDPDSATDMARAISQLMDDEALRRRCAERGVARARTFSWAATARATAEVLRAAAGRDA